MLAIRHGWRPASRRWWKKPIRIQKRLEGNASSLPDRFIQVTVDRARSDRWEVMDAASAASAVAVQSKRTLSFRYPVSWN